ncbi:hypothetical protein CN934_32325 [Ensifer sp. MMN_5]|nr:hypothetical protein CN934_32325 [Ensifer sp. MMN_5]
MPQHTWWRDYIEGSVMHEKKISQAEIARALGRDLSTICRELRRNLRYP